jgi:hypothetical protein
VYQAGLRGVAHNALGRFETRHLQLGLAVHALLQGQAVLEGRHLDLVIGQQRLADHHGQE